MFNPELPLNPQSGGRPETQKLSRLQKIKNAMAIALAPFVVAGVNTGCAADTVEFPAGEGGTAAGGSGGTGGVAGGGSGPCVPTGDEVCDGLDNDCDGEVDNGLTPPQCELYAGECAGAESVCAGEDGWQCDYGDKYEADEEVSCDGLDNDCDGQIDEPEDVDNHKPACPLNDGVCEGASDKRECTDGNWTTCEEAYGDAYEPVEESCDGLDNDCDKTVDNSSPTTGCVSTLGSVGFFEQLINSNTSTFDPIDGSTGNNACEQVNKVFMAQPGNLQIVWRFGGDNEKDVRLVTDYPPVSAEAACSVEALNCPNNQQMWDDYNNATQVVTVQPSVNGNEYTYISSLSCLRHFFRFYY